MVSWSGSLAFFGDNWVPDPLFLCRVVQDSVGLVQQLGPCAALHGFASATWGDRRPAILVGVRCAKQVHDLPLRLFHGVYGVILLCGISNVGQGLCLASCVFFLHGDDDGVHVLVPPHLAGGWLCCPGR